MYVHVSKTFQHMRNENNCRSVKDVNENFTKKNIEKKAKCCRYSV